MALLAFFFLGFSPVSCFFGVYEWPPLARARALAGKNYRADSARVGETWCDLEWGLIACWCGKTPECRPWCECVC